MANKTARYLRKNQTVDEQKLWEELRALRVQGYHFRRQAPIENYIVDFACLSHRVIIEVDGIQHHTIAGRARDLKRDNYLEWKGFKVLRFSNGDVTANLDGVMAEILAVLGVVVWQE